MKEFLKRAGLIFIVGGIGMIIIKQIAGIDSNTLLAASGASIVFGIVLYVVLNYFIE